jgi:hypothetical protein
MLSLISLIPSVARCAWTSFQCCAIAYTCNGIKNCFKNCCISIKNFCCCYSTNTNEIITAIPIGPIGVVKQQKKEEEVAFPELELIQQNNLNPYNQQTNLIGQDHQDSEEVW